MQFKIVLEPQPEGGFTAYSPVFPGCVSEGKTEDEARGNFLDALEAWLEVKGEGPATSLAPARARAFWKPRPDSCLQPKHESRP